MVAAALATKMAIIGMKQQVAIEPSEL